MRIREEQAAKGMLDSSVTSRRCHDRRMATLTTLLTERLQNEREQPRAAEDEETWYRDLVTDISRIIGQNHGRMRARWTARRWRTNSAVYVAGVNILHTEGHEKLAEVLKALSESIAAAPEMSDRDKAESLDLVSGIGEELARPGDQRRAGVLRSLAQRLMRVLGHVATLQGAHDALKIPVKVYTGEDLLP